MMVEGWIPSRVVGEKGRDSLSSFILADWPFENLRPLILCSP
jgi:hypothetical protein